MKTLTISTFCTAALLLGSIGGAHAHPHVWVSMQTSVAFNDAGLVMGVDVEWTFDDAYAQVALEGMDKNEDGVYSADELEPLTRENLEALKDYNYFTFMKVDGEKQTAASVINAGQIYSNNQLTLHFTVPLQAPVDPRQHEFTVKVYDPEFYIAFDYVTDDPADAAGPMPAGCAIDIKPIPTTAELEQTKSMLATKGKDWKPDDADDFGGMFAQPVSVVCR